MSISIRSVLISNINCHRILPGAMLLTCLCASAFSSAQPGTIIRFDASQPYIQPRPALYVEGSATSPSGNTLGLNSRYLTLNGKPWLPVMGEFHFSRYPKAEWEQEILKMKAAGVNIVATYVIWIHHEEIKGEFDWTGQRDLRAFAQLCARHGLYLLPRIGPWDHAEVRNGGLPDWVLQQGPTRENDPVYLASVRTWYRQVGEQLKGLLFKDGGPVIGIQLENEYSRRGPRAGQAHILELKKIAIASGLDVPLYLVTGWDDAVIPPRAVLPVYGGYPSAPWDGSVHKLAPAEVYAFRFHSRAPANPNAGNLKPASKPEPAAPSHLPYLTAEIGGGNQDTYHRRPVIHADDVAAMFPVMLGSGVNLYGTYMFHGGENPDGKLSTLQESQATGYPNDLPIKSYDFQAPIGEFGRERASLRKLKVFQYFLNDFGSCLAPMVVRPPALQPSSASDLSVPRASIRIQRNSGFIFFNNYVRGYTMPARPAAQFQIHLPHGELIVPRQPVDLPSGSYFIWPFNLRLAGVTLRYSTAQLFARITDAKSTTIYFEALPGIPVEFAFDKTSVRSMLASSGTRTDGPGEIYLDGIKPGVDSNIALVSAEGKLVHLVVLTAQQAEDAWKIRLRGKEHLLITPQDFFADAETRPERIWLQSRKTPDFAFSITPPPAAPVKASLPLTTTSTTDHAESFAAQANPREIELVDRQVHSPGIAPPVKLGPTPDWRRQGVAEAPPASELPQAARWSITIPPGSLQGLSNIFLQIQYQGDVARFYSGHKLLTDNFYNGAPWTIGLKRFLNPQGGGSFTLSILPLRCDAPVYFELLHKPDFSACGQVDTLQSIRVIPEYQLQIGTADQ